MPSRRLAFAMTGGKKHSDKGATLLAVRGDGVVSQHDLAARHTFFDNLIQLIAIILALFENSPSPDWLSRSVKTAYSY